MKIFIGIMSAKKMADHMIQNHIKPFIYIGDDEARAIDSNLHEAKRIWPMSEHYCYHDAGCNELDDESRAALLRALTVGGHAPLPEHEFKASWVPSHPSPPAEVIHVGPDHKTIIALVHT